MKLRSVKIRFGVVSQVLSFKGQSAQTLMSSELQACVCVCVCILLCKKEKKTRVRQGTKVECLQKTTRDQSVSNSAGERVCLCVCGGGVMRGDCVTCRGRRTCGFHVNQPVLQTDADVKQNF